MTKHMGPAQQALCYFYRNPPAKSGVMPQPFKEIAKLIRQPRTPADTIRWVVRNFHRVRKVRGRRPGWRKTTPAEDAKIFACFRKVRRPLGSLVESQDVWKALPATLRAKVTPRTVANRLAEKGFSMKDKLAGDDNGEPVGPTELMRAWPVMEVVRFLEGRDLTGPAELLRRSGVNGADLLQLSQQDLCTDVLLTPFAARKVVAARDEFLNC